MRFVVNEIPMKKQILIINGATRVEGNTDILLGRFVQGVASAEGISKVVDLRGKKIGGCIGCYQCLREFTCSLADDMTEIRTEIEASDLLVFASPVYWCGVPGLMKTFIDRFFFYYHPQNNVLLSGKKATVLAPLNQKNVAHETALLVEFFERFFSCLGIKIIGMHFFSGIMDKAAVLQKTEYLEEAFQVGKGLAQSLNIIP